METINTRSPSEEGEWETGTFSHAANDLALMCMTWGDFMPQLDTLFSSWDAHMTKWAHTTKSLTKAEAEKASLAFLLEFGATLLDDARTERNSEETETPDEIRDWFCWLHRHMKETKQERQIWNNR